MADVVVGPLVQNLVFLLQTEFTLIGGVKKDVEKLTGTLSTIHAVLEDAEAKQVKDKSIADWLNKLKDAAYDAEDALDLWLTSTRQRELALTDDAGSSKQVSCSIPTCLNFNEIIFRHKIAKRLKEIISKIDDIAEQRSKFHLNISTVPQTEYSRLDQKRETSSILSEPKIYGRDNDQKNIIDQLLSNDSQENLCVFPLVGFGGVGKTTLAQLVYNDERVVGRFKTRVWACVSEPFDLKRILKAIIESLQQQSCTLESLQSIQTQVQELLKDKKYLLVLDDVWNENQDEWNKLRSSITSGAKGSSVVLTTRSPTVASITATITPYCVGVLSDDDCWSLLKHRALGDRGEEQYPNLVPIGKEIVERCKGVPLAAKSLGSLLCSKLEENHWKYVRDNEIWNFKSGEDDILPALRLSYNHLPPNLKQCFSYCSIFPKDHQIDKTNLIYLWMANGFIQPKGKMELEEIGDGIFNELLRWSFFQDTKEDLDGNILRCKMHDLMHDLACSVAANDCRIVNVDEIPNPPNTIRHLTMILNSKQSSTTIDPPFLRSLPSLRTLSFLDSPNINGLVFQRTLRVLDISDTGMTTLSPSVFHLKQLRYLNLSGNDLKSLQEPICRLVNLQVLNLSQNRKLETLPSSIGRLEHLRYLDLSPSKISSLPDSICRLRNLWWLNLSHNEKLTILPLSIGNLTNLRHLNLTYCQCLESLPETICDLMNLQSLLLWGCDKIKEFPKNMKNMRSLIHLDIWGCWKLRKLAGGIGELTSLRTLGHFPVGDDSERRDGGAAGINELHGLNQLRGEFWIVGLENVRNEEEARMANLRSKQYLTTIVLKWSYNEDGSLQVISDNNKSQEVLQGLLLPQLSPNLKYLRIDGYGAEEIPAGIFQGEGGGVLNTTLRCLDIFNCSKLKSLPAEIGNLAALKSLEILRCEELVSLPQEVQKLTSLTKLIIRECNRIKCLPTIGGGVGSESNSFLHAVAISECRNLTSVSEGLRYLTSLKYLQIRDCRELELELGTPGFEHLVSLETLELINLPKLTTALPQGIRHLGMLRELKIKSCPELAFEEEDLRNLVSLVHLELDELPKLTTLPDAIQHLPMLQELEISDCKNLRTLPDWLKHLTTLQSLKINGCCQPDLKERYKRDEGEDWHKISHIPQVSVD